MGRLAAMKAAGHYCGRTLMSACVVGVRRAITILKRPLGWTTTTWTLLLTVLTVYLMVRQIDLAHEQIRLANEQTRLAQEQSMLAREQAALGREQTALGREQTALAQRQTVIIEKQDELLSRRAEMQVAVSEERRESDAIVLSVILKNTGKKAADGYYWHLFFPPGVAGVVPAQALVGDRTIDGVVYKQYRGHVATKLYPTRTFALTEFKIPIPKVKESTTLPVSLRWQIVTDDGIFPPSASDEPGALDFFMKITVPAHGASTATPPASQ